MVTRKRAEPEVKPQHGLKMRLDDMMTINPKTEKQKEFFDAYQQGHYFCALSGVAGTGKTYIAFYKALEEVMDKSNPYQKLVIIRSSVQSREMGHLPGDADEKMNQFTEPYKQITAELFKRKDAWDRLVEQGYVEFLSTSFIRGTTFNNAIVILDESQNCTMHELDTIITRIGHTSKFFLCGDYRQVDLTKKNDKSGLLEFLTILRSMKEFTEIEFSVADIVRSSLVKNYIIARINHEDKKHDATH